MTEEKYYLFDVLETEKNMVVNMAIALNEASNEDLYRKLYKMFDSISVKTKELFTLAYDKGWYTLEETGVTKIDKEITKLNGELNK